MVRERPAWPAILRPLAPLRENASHLFNARPRPEKVERIGSVQPPACARVVVHQRVRARRQFGHRHLGAMPIHQLTQPRDEGQRLRLIRIPRMHLHVARQRWRGIARRRIVPQLRVVEVVVRHVEPEAIHAQLQPETRNVDDRRAHIRVVEIQLRLRRQEVVQVVLPPRRLPRPRRPAEPGLPVARRRSIGLGISPDIPVSSRVRPVAPALVKPLMVGRGMRPHLVDDDLQVLPMRRLQQRPEIVERPEHRIDIAIIRNVIAKVPHRAAEERRQPHAIDAQRLHMVELRRDPLEVTNAIAVRIHERPRINLVEHGPTPPVAVPAPVPCSRHG